MDITRGFREFPVDVKRGGGEVQGVASGRRGQGLRVDVEEIRFKIVETLSIH